MEADDGDLTLLQKLKANLVSNATLSHISGLYNLPRRLIADPNLLPVLRAQTDVRAALMEAYIAGIYFSYPPDQRILTALPILDAWLREMYEPLYDFFATYMKTEWDQHNAVGGLDDDGSAVILSEAEMAQIDKAATGMAPLVQMFAHKRERELRWDDETFETNMGVVWRVKCYIDGIELGEGMRANKKAAKNLASWEAAKKLGLSVSDWPGHRGCSTHGPVVRLRFALIVRLFLKWFTSITSPTLSMPNQTICHETE